MRTGSSTSTRGSEVNNMDELRIIAFVLSLTAFIISIISLLRR